jgi:alpha-tubulin suppressor-like RCC1 family protein
MDSSMGPVEVAAGEQSSCARTSVGPVYCWGENFLGQLGDGTVMAHSLPVATKGLKDVLSIHSGAGFTFARKPFTLSGWGDDSSDQLATGVAAVFIVEPAVVVW